MLRPDVGEVVRARNLVVAMMPQVVPAELPGTVLETVRQGTRADQDAWHRDTQAKKVISLMELDGGAECATLSGGMKRRVLLAQALAAEPDVLLLDEPTNHLDVESIEWLESFLLRFPGAILFVTHDRAFLRRVATRIVELDRASCARGPAATTNSWNARRRRWRTKSGKMPCSTRSSRRKKSGCARASRRGARATKAACAN